MAAHVLRDLPIARKLMLITLVASAAAVLIASTIFATADALEYRRAARAHIATLGDVIATNSAAAITFEDRALAREVLASLRADDEILAARMFSAGLRPLADYDAGHAGGAWHAEEVAGELQQLLESAASSGAAAERFEGLDHLLAVRPIRFDGEVIGFLQIHASLDGLATSLRRVALTALFTVLLAIVAAYLLSIRLQRVVSQPIRSLSDLMKRVTTEQDYSLRAPRAGRDEIGVLMQGFNDMLDQIGARDLKLEEHQHALAEQNRNVEETNRRLTAAIEDSLHAKEAAESASRAKSDFLARMSHEIRTPMNGVLGMAELLLSSDLDATERKFAETIQQSGESLLAVINDILDFSKIEAGRLELEDACFDVAEVIESIVDLMYSRAHSHGVELIAGVEPGLHTTVRGDGVRVRQILMNLVGNAVKFTHAGEIVLSVFAERSDKGDDLYRFEVRDSGIGIDAQNQALIFDRFSQADVSTTRQYGGTGLGLAICKQLVELMGGEIGVTSSPGEGSTFFFKLPLEKENLPADLSPTAEVSLLGDVRILVVDDNDTNRELLVNQLAAWQVEPAAARNATEALYLVEQACHERTPFDVLLLDFFMPDKDGLGLTRDIRSRQDLHQPHVLMLSSARPGYQAQELRDAGIDVYLTKPVRRRPLFNAIRYALADGAQAATDTPASPTAAQPPATRFDAKVLLVEDIPVNLQVARLMLEGLGCRVMEAVNGQEALRVMDRDPPDIVFMDCQMPVMDGFTATRAQRRREAEDDRARLPIVALTANALSEDRQRCLDAGMDDFISKPFARQALVEALQRWCDPPAPGAGRTAPRPPESDERDAAVLDPAALQQIADLDPDGSAGLVDDVVETYVENSRALLASLGEAISDGEPEACRSAAHALKSSSGNVGGVRLMKLSAQMEKQAREGVMAGADDALCGISAAHAALLDELKKCRSGVAA